MFVSNTIDNHATPNSPTYSPTKQAAPHTETNTHSLHSTKCT